MYTDVTNELEVFPEPCRSAELELSGDERIGTQ